MKYASGIRLDTPRKLGVSHQERENAEPLEDHDRFIVQVIIGISQAFGETRDGWAPILLVGQLELSGVRVALSLVSGVLVVDVDEAHEANFDCLNDRDRSLLRVDQHFAPAGRRDGFAGNFKLREKAGRSCFGA